jgi:3-oxo-5-alpha-steroid 4-dehydrogenase 3
MTSLAGLVRAGVCLVDDYATAACAALVTVALFTQVAPFLKTMTMHGKLRQLVKDVPEPSDQSNQIQQSYVRWFMEGSYWMVEKKRFQHFYALGILAVGTVRLMAASSERLDSVRTVAQSLLLLHVLRRLYECIYVHQWRSSSRMHWLIYLLGLFYYTILPFFFCRLDCHDTLVEKKDLDHRLGFGRMLAVLASTVLCLWGQYQQYRHHILLASLRRDDPTPARKSRQPANYSLPTGGWFYYVACPHYLAEIILYSGLVAVQGLAPEATRRDIERGAVLLLWVTVNLTISSLESHAWYRSRIPGYARLRRKAIWPFWL